MAKIRILIVDDHELILSGLRDMLGSIENVEIVGEAIDGQEAFEKANTLKPDIIFMDISMPVMNGIDATRLIVENLPEIKIIALTQHEESEYVMQVLNVGGFGYLLKNSKKEEFVEAIDAVRNGRKYLSQNISQQMLKAIAKKNADKKLEEKEIPLTKREKEIIQKIADDLSNQQIADELHISLRTVETHRRNLMQKLKVKSVVALLKYAAQHNIIKFD